ARSGAEPHDVWIEGRDLAEDLKRFVWHQDEPVAHTSQFAQWKVMKLARDCGVTVLLDGQGADEIIGGQPSPTLGGRCAELTKTGSLLALVRRPAAFQRHYGTAVAALRYLAAARLPNGLKHATRQRVMGTGGFAAAHPNGDLAPPDDETMPSAPLLRRS